MLVTRFGHERRSIMRFEDCRREQVALLFWDARRRGRGRVHHGLTRDVIDYATSFSTLAKGLRVSQDATLLASCLFPVITSFSSCFARAKLV